MNRRLVARNSLWLLVGRIATALLNLLLTVLIARYLGEAGYGQYAFIVSLAYLGNTATTFGMDTLVMRSVARQSMEETADEATAALILQLGLSIVYLEIIAIASLFLGGPRAALLTYLLILLPLAFGTIYSAVLRGIERMELHALYLLTGALLQTGGAAVVLWRGGDLLSLAIVIVVGQMGAALLAGWLVKRVGLRLRWQHISAERLRSTLKMGGALALLAILAVFSAQLPIFALRTLTDDATVGQFSAASRLVDGTKMVPAAMFGALFPPLVRGVGQSKRYHQLFWGMVALFLIGIALGIGLAEPLIQLIYAGYSAATPVLKILLIGLLPHLFRLRYSFELVTQGSERFALRDILITGFIALPTFYIGITMASLQGAAWAVVITTTVQALLHYYTKRRLAVFASQRLSC